MQHAEIIHDYNYAQVLTLNLARKGFRVKEVPIHTMSVRLGRLLSRLEAIFRQSFQRFGKNGIERLNESTFKRMHVTWIG